MQDGIVQGKNNNLVSHITLSALMFYLALLTKPFYILPSGSFQIGDFFMMLAFLSLFIGGKKAHLESSDRYFIVFLVGVILINLFYYFRYFNFSFIRSILFFFFNFLVIIIVRNNYSDGFLKGLEKVCKFNILLQLFIFIIGKGAWLGAYRFMGTYNDPNQFAYGLFSTYLILYCINRKLRVKFLYLFFLITSFLIFRSYSMGMLLGMAMLFVFDIYAWLYKHKSSLGYGLYYFLIISFTVILIVFLVMFVGDLVGGRFSLQLFRRVRYKINRRESIINSFLLDRHLDNIINHPLVLLYGSGEGLMDRFNSVGDARELHSTWLGLLFYYGIIPVSFLFVWIYKNIKRIDKSLIPVLIALFFEALTLINHRQPSFWILILLFSYCSVDTKDEPVQ